MCRRRPTQEILDTVNEKNNLHPSVNLSALDGTADDWEWHGRDGKNAIHSVNAISCCSDFVFRTRVGVRCEACQVQRLPATCRALEQAGVIRQIFCDVDAVPYRQNIHPRCLLK